MVAPNSNKYEQLIQRLAYQEKKQSCSSTVSFGGASSTVACSRGWRAGNVGRLFGEGAERAQAAALDAVFVAKPTASVFVSSHRKSSAQLARPVQRCARRRSW